MLNAVLSLTLAIVAVALYAITHERILLFAAGFFGVGGIAHLALRDDARNQALTMRTRHVLAGDRLGTLTGAGIGALAASVNDNYIYMAIGIVGGSVVGTGIGLVTRRLAASGMAVRLARNVDVALAVFGLVMSAIAVMGFIGHGNVLFLVGAVFFAACGVGLFYLRR